MAAPNTFCCQTPLYQLNQALEQVQWGDAPCCTSCSGAERQLGQKCPRPWPLGVLPAICHVKDIGNWIYTVLLLLFFQKRTTEHLENSPALQAKVSALFPSQLPWLDRAWPAALSRGGGCVWLCPAPWSQGSAPRASLPAADAQRGQGPCPATSSPLPKSPPWLGTAGTIPPRSPSLADSKNSSRWNGSFWGRHSSLSPLSDPPAADLMTIITSVPQLCA